MIYFFYLTIGLYLTVFYGLLLVLTIANGNLEDGSLLDKIARFLWYGVGSAALVSTFWLFFTVSYIIITGR